MIEVEYNIQMLLSGIESIVAAAPGARQIAIWHAIPIKPPRARDANTPSTITHEHLWKIRQSNIHSFPLQ